MTAPSQAEPLLPASIPEVLAAVRDTPRVLPIGAGTKTALASPPAGFVALALRRLTDIVEYDPGEYTFTALAGTPLAEIARALAAHGQYLPFDPPFGAAGATLGGTIGAGLSGPGRQRYGGVRDFILGVRFVTGAGELARGGGKVVKNAAGFDLPKLLAGSLGRLGVVVEATFKVFPHPRAMATLHVEHDSFDATLRAVTVLAAAPFDLEAIELSPPGALWLRLGGVPETFPDRLARLGQLVGGRATRMEAQAEGAFWRADPWCPLQAGESLVKVPVTLAAIPEFDRVLAAAGAARRYSAGGSLVWINWPSALTELDALLRQRGLAGVVLLGSPSHGLLGATRGDSFRQRVKSALDPAGRFPEF